jgi:hypothetical protein
MSQTWCLDCYMSWLRPVCGGFHNFIRFNCTPFFASCRRHGILTVTCLDLCRCAAVFIISFVSTVLLSLRHVADIVSWLLHVLTHAGVRPTLDRSATVTGRYNNTPNKSLSMNPLAVHRSNDAAVYGRGRYAWVGTAVSVYTEMSWERTYT